MSYESWHTYFLLLEFPALDVDAFLAGAFLADGFDFFEVDAFAALFDVLGPDVDASFAAPFFAPFFNDPPCFSHKINSGK